MSFKKEVTYFDEIKQENTDELLDVVSEYIRLNDIRDIVISTNSGKSAVDLIGKIDAEKLNVVAVSLHSGFHNGDDISWNEEYKNILEDNGVSCFIGSHALSGIDRGISRRFGGFNPSELIAEVYKTVSEGFKVAVEVSIMAADAGLIPTSRKVLAIGGHKSFGVDTAIVLTTSHMNNIFDLKVHEILAMSID